MADLGNQSTLFLEENVVEEDYCVEMNEIIPGNDQIAPENMEIVPEVGMTFSSHEEAFQFYKQYAYSVGFPIRKRDSKKGPDGMLLYVTFACSREGKRVSATSSTLKPHPTIQTGCKAKMIACSDVLGKWRVTKVFLDHNQYSSSQPILGYQFQIGGYGDAYQS